MTNPTLDVYVSVPHAVNTVAQRQRDDARAPAQARWRQEGTSRDDEAIVIWLGAILEIEFCTGMARRGQDKHGTDASCCIVPIVVGDMERP